MAATAGSEATDGPVLSLINKRLRALRKKHNRILQMEESLSQGKTLNKEQEEVLRSKPAVTVLIDELEKLRSPLSAAVTEEINLALQRHQTENQLDDDEEPSSNNDDASDGVEDLLNLLYFGSLFDVKSQNDFTSIMVTKTHERGCCLTYDYVTDDATDLLGERDLDLISTLGGLMISRPVDSSLSHKNALERCIEHAKLWLENSDQPIDSNANISYAGLREKLKKIMASDYFTTTPEMKAPVEVAAAANYASFQVPVVPVGGIPVQVEGGSVEHHQQKEEEDISNFQEDEADDEQPSPTEEHEKDDPETQTAAEVIPDQQEQVNPQAEQEYNQRDFEHKEQQYVPRRSYQNNPRGGRGGGGRRGYPNGRGVRGGSGRGGGGGYQNGRSQYYDHSGGNYYQRNYYNNRGRGGGRGGGHHDNSNHGSAAAQGGRASSDVGVAS